MLALLPSVLLLFALSPSVGRGSRQASDPQASQYAVVKDESLDVSRPGVWILRFEAFNERFVLSLLPQADLVEPGVYTVLQDGPGAETYRQLPPHPCHYQGRVTSHGNASAAISICPSLRGIIALRDHFLVIHPKSDESKAPQGHVIYKRYASLQQIEETVFHRVQEEHFCDVEASVDQLPQLVQHDYASGALPQSVSLELAVFTDHKLWQMFQKSYGNATEMELQDYALSLINNVDLLYGQPSIRPKLNIKVVHFEIWKSAPTSLQPDVHKHGEAQLFLDAFCRYQSRLKGAWDHATLLTGYDVYHTTASVAGVAPVARMCDPSFSCSLIEGNHLGRSFVMAHEMGHNMGMLHDGIQNQCSQTCCLMSPVNGAGRTAWSPCSVREYRSFLVSITRPESSIRNCLLTDDSRTRNSLPGVTMLPGQRYTADEQCRFFSGPQHRLDLPAGKSLADICYVLWCSNGGATISSAHPALDGTWCGGAKWCKNGQCVAWSAEEAPPPVNGQWSQWTTGQVRASCSDCTVKGAIRLRREVRTCTAPSPNNGGKECAGSSIRGIPCNGPASCDDMSKSDFADRICTAIRDDPIKPDKQLSGVSFQHESAPCKVWCHLDNTMMIRSKGRYPDGTPCGVRHYCVAGRCEPQLCDDGSVVASPTECPSSNDPSPAWSFWSSWTPCSVSCGTGKRSRFRSCLTGSCSESNKEESSCEMEPCQASWSDWSQWTGCSVSCGEGLRMRSRKCSSDNSACDGKSIDFERCSNVCDANWAEWSSWSQCSRTCGIGVRRRYRLCRGDEQCAGSSVEIILCGSRSCPEMEWSQWSMCTGHCGGGVGVQRRHRVCNPEPADCDEMDIRSCENQEPCADWTSWSPWNPCSSSCGAGTQSRSRQCTGTHPYSCLGNSTETRLCHGVSCDQRELYAWSEWTQCSASCGGGIRVRSRNCLESAKCASYVQRVICNENPCPKEMAKYSEWQSWSSCSSPCGEGQRQRMRQCLSGSCVSADLVETVPCQNVPCSFESYWTEWSEWTSCSVTCGGGRQSRKRDCIHGSVGATECNGFSMEEQSCNTAPCPGVTSDARGRRSLSSPTWSEWSSWSRCSCHTGTRIRTRLCPIQDLQTRGFCLGEHYQEASCSSTDCDSVNGAWTQWTVWSSCSAGCSGKRIRQRLCSDPLPVNRGEHCPGESVDVKQCDDHCDTDNPIISGHWQTWTQWSDCTGAVCGRRKRQRTRVCEGDLHAPYSCDGVDFEVKLCSEAVDCSSFPLSSWSQWSAWSVCSSSCGRSVKRRHRRCQMPPPLPGVNHYRGACLGAVLDTLECDVPPCLNDVHWSAWSSWSKCSSYCGDGLRTRSRMCEGESSACTGPASKSEHCSGDIADALCSSTVSNHELIIRSIQRWEFV